MKVGLILYSVREEMAKDPLATVEKVGQLGYKFVETCNHNAIADPGCGFGIPAEQLKETFDKHGVSEDEAAEEYRRLRMTSFTEIGSGIMPIQKIIEAANQYTAAEYIILEQDFTRMPTQIDSIARSMEEFHKFSGIEWD